MNNFDLYTLKEISALLGLSYSTVYSYAVSGVFPCFRIGTRYYSHKDTFTAWFDSKVKGGVNI